jgi:hypothetical protein
MSIRFLCAAALLGFVGAPATADPKEAAALRDPTKWPEAVVPPDDSPTFERFRRDVWRSNTEWWVTAERGRVTASDHRPSEPSPFFSSDLKELPEIVRLNLAPSVKAIDVEGGWRVGFSAGEWEAALMWYSANGKASRLVSEDQVNQFVKTKDGVFAVTGLDHLSYGGGSVCRFVRKDGKWSTEKVAELPESSAVAAAALPDGGLLVATGHRVVRVDSEGTVETLVSSSGCSPFLGWPFQPNSVAIDADGRVFLGMQQFVAVYDPKDPVGFVQFRTPTKNWVRLQSK